MIDFRHLEHVEDARFSILIPTWNNLPFLQLCVRSIRQHSAFTHQIIIHVNEGTDGTLEWVRENRFSYTYSSKNIGVCWSMNAMRNLAETDYLVFLNDDMYVCPGWDSALASEIASLPDNRFYLSSTVLQPRRFWCKSVISPASFGEDVRSFQEDDLLKHFRDIPHYDWRGATWPPAIVHRELWDLVGGYSIEYSPGLYSDPDFSAKLYMAGVRYFKGVNNSRVYHFEARSTGRVKKNKGSRQFLAKWGITASTFTSVILQRGLPFDEGADNRKPGFGQLFRNRLKRVFTCMLPSGSRDRLWEK